MWDPGGQDGRDLFLVVDVCVHEGFQSGDHLDLVVLGHVGEVGQEEVAELWEVDRDQLAIG